MQMRNLLAVCATLFYLAPAPAELPEGLLWDDPYAWFEVDGESIMEDGKPKDLGWRLKYEFRIFGDTPDHSAYKLVIGKDGSELGSLRVEGNESFHGMEAKDTHWHTLDQGAANLTAWKQNIVGTGVYDLDIYYIDGKTQKEYLARSYELDVRAAHRVRGAGVDAVADAPDYYINRHGDAPWSVIVRRPSQFPYYLKTGHGGLAGENTVDVYWNAVPREGELAGKTVSSQTWIGGRLRVKVDGKPIDLGSEPIRSQVVNDAVREEYVKHTDRNTEQYHVGAAYQEDMHFTTYHTRLPLTWRDDAGEYTTRQASGSITYEARPREGYVALNDHPGRWEAEWIVNGEVIRTWIFDVTKDGKIKPWKAAPEHITLHPFASIIEMNIPENGSSVDGRLTPEFVRDGAFYGLGLPKIFARKVPTKGQPFPQFSGPYVAPVDPQAERRAKYEAEKAAREAAADARVAERVAKAEARKAETEAERAARNAQRAVDAEAAKLAADEAFEKAKQDAVSASREALAAAAAARANAEKQREELERKAKGAGGSYFVMRILLSVALIGLGFILAGGMLKGMVAPLAGTVDALTQQANVIGLVSIGLALVDFLLDLVVLRPIVGDGLPQIAALAGGVIAAKATLAKQAAVQKHEAKLAPLEAQSQNIGIACLVLGILHLLLGGVALL